MSEQILSQVEVDALLKGLSNGEISTEAAKAEKTGEVAPYDFENQVKSIRGKMRALEMINEKFCRNARGALFNVIRKSVDLTPVGIQTMRYGEFLQNLKVPSSLNIYQLHPLRGQALMAVNPDLVFIIIDSYFGGDGRFHSRVEGREFTNVEQAVVRKVVDVIFSEMDNVWRPVHPVEHRFVRSEMNPQFVNLVNVSEVVVTSTFKMEVESLSENFTFCMPYSTVEPIMEKLYGMRQGDIEGEDAGWKQRLNDQIRSVPFHLTAEVGTAEIRVSDLVNLRVGDIIQLDKKARDPLDVFVEGVRKYRARPGVMDNNYSVKITSIVNERG